MATISSDILASYAADAARDVAGVRGLVEKHLPGRRGVRVSDEDGRVRIELHLPSIGGHRFRRWGAPCRIASVNTSRAWPT